MEKPYPAHFLSTAADPYVQADFVLFILITSRVVLNLLFAVIVHAMGEQYEEARTVEVAETTDAAHAPTAGC